MVNSESDSEPENNDEQYNSDQENSVDYEIEVESDEGDPFSEESDDYSLFITYENKSKTFQWKSLPQKIKQTNVQQNPSSKGFQMDLSMIKSPKSAFLH